jgi:hypothetical protein
LCAFADRDVIVQPTRAPSTTESSSATRQISDLRCQHTKPPDGNIVANLHEARCAEGCRISPGDDGKKTPLETATARLSAAIADSLVVQDEVERFQSHES